jgi:citronellol/citronellal dehydrogenase
LSLKGKTLFITGASRGIGLAIALRAARDGANIVVVAKTAEEHRHLQAVAAFGGIDIVVNNASAISLAGVEQTEMKRFDLMHQVNVRGTYLVSRICIPHLRRAVNPHVLTISPPLDLSPRWFAGRVAYAISKFGMSQCVLGMAEEFRGSGIAFNALWPRSMVATAAIEFGIADAATLRGCRRPDIMADAAYVILNRSARDCTGNFFIDDSLLYEAGVRDFDQYRVDPAAPLHEDLFVPELPSAPPGVALRAWQ